VSQQLEAAQRPLGQVARFVRRAAVHFFERQRDVFQRGHVRKKIEGLEHRADGAPMPQQRLVVIFDRLVVQDDRAAGRIFEPGDDPQQGRFAAAGRPDQREAMDIVEFEARPGRSRCARRTASPLPGKAKFHT
jgi:hypothetical protein